MTRVARKAPVDPAGGSGFAPNGFMGSAGNFVGYLLMGLGGALVASDLLGIFFGPDGDDK